MVISLGGDLGDPVCCVVIGLGDHGFVGVFLFVSEACVAAAVAINLKYLEPQMDTDKHR
jgi:hypothetical protein